MQSIIVEPKPGANVGRLVVPIKVWNPAAANGDWSGDSVPDNALTVEALVDTGATFLCLPAPIIQQLGLRFQRSRPTRTVGGLVDMRVYTPVMIDIQGRSCSAEVMQLPNGRQALLGQIPLETLDYWVDLTNGRLVGNPEHGGVWMAEL